MKKYRFNLSTVSSVTYSEEQYKNLQEQNVEIDNKVILCKTLIVEDSDLKNEYYVFAPVNQFEIIETSP